MIHTRSAVPLLAGLAFAAFQTASASPLVYINQGQSDACTITPAAGTVFTLNATGDVLITGSYTSGACGSTGGTTSGDPTFTPFSPAPANLTVTPTSLSSSGGTVTPAFVVYYANSCNGSITPTAGCAAATGSAWANGTQVCTGQTNAAGQKYCTPSGTVTLPANTLATACTYTFRATNCTNGTTQVSSQTSAVTVAAFQTGSCIDGDSSGDTSFVRQCSGSLHSQNNNVSAVWDNTYQKLMGGTLWPGALTQNGYWLQITLADGKYGSFKFNTGSTPSGIHFEPNNSAGLTGAISVSTSPGDFYSGTVVPGCTASSSTNISSKTGTTANCKLALNTDYYLNVAMLNFDGTDGCANASCTMAVTTYLPFTN